MEDRTVLTFGCVGIFSLLLLITISTSGGQVNELYTGAAVGTRMVTGGIANSVNQRGTIRLTSVVQPVPQNNGPLSQGFQHEETTMLYGEVDLTTVAVDNKPAIFNALATSFFAVLFYVRRKASLTREYIGLENGHPTLSIATVSAHASTGAEGEQKSGLWKTITSLDYGLLLCLTFWYVGNYYYNITNKYALKATGGAAGAPLTVASLQLAVGVLYGIFLWVAPDARKVPQISWNDIMKMVPLSIAFAGAHFSTVFAMSAGAVSFGQIVKASEPAFAALLGTMLYSQTISTAKWLSLIPVIGGVCLASAAELDFSVAALISGVMANLFAAVKANENKKAMDTPGLKDRLGHVGNQFAVTMTLSWLLSLPLVLLAEWKQLPGLVAAWKTNPIVSFNVISAGLWFYLYNELATIVVKKTGAVTQSVANTAKRVIVIVACGLVLGESLDTLKLVGCTIGILGVFLYSIIDDIIKPKPKAATGTA